ncbi:MAG: hypothetical protein IJL69_05845 [Oscillospiraceae bacterium]|nr:hypothetical protein [Oscillospiraceae bacterium]
MNGYQNFRFSVFLTVGCLAKMFGPDGDPEAQFDYYARHLKFEKVYLECFRGEATPLDRLLAAKAFFEARGVETATAIMPSHVNAFDSSARMLCFTNPDVQRLFSEYIASMGAYFGEIMIDDSLATDCTCERCRKAKGDRSWSEFRTALMTDFCRDYILAPARAVNPNVRVTLKYPTWHESFQELGYDTETQPPMFDEIYSGTETRHTTYSLFRNPRYTSYSLIRYLQSLPPHNNRGGWFDSILCANNMNYFCEQAELTLLSSPREVTLFDWSLNLDTMFPPALGYFLDRTDRFLGELGAPAGVPVYLPHHSRGEDHVFDFLGMCGVPADPTVTFPDRPRLVICTAASCCDPDLTGKLKAHLLAGGDAVLTSGCLALLQDRPDFEFTAMRVTGRSCAGQQFGGFDAGWSTDVAYRNAEKAVSLPVIEWMTNENEFFAVQTQPGFPNILLARSWYGAGKCWVLNVPDDMADYSAVPPQVMDTVRKYLSRDLPVWLEGENDVALFPRDNDTFAVKSFLEHGSPALFHVRGSRERLTDLTTGRSYAPYTRLSRARQLFTDPGNLTLPVADAGVETVFRVPLSPLTLHAFRWE